MTHALSWNSFSAAATITGIEFSRSTFATVIRSSASCCVSAGPVNWPLVTPPTVPPETPNPSPVTCRS